MLDIQLDGNILRLTLNRPEKRNALTLEFCRRLVAALDNADSDPSVHAVLLSATGKAFCAGMDISEIGMVNEAEVSSIHNALFTAASRMTTPIIAAVDGAALGGGTGVVANAHIVVAGPGATFGLTEIRLGLWPFLVFRSVAAAIGERRALEWSISGRVVEAKEARDCGLVHHLSDNAFGKAAEIARSVTNPIAVRSGMEYVREARGKSIEEAGEIARRVRAQIVTGDEFAEGWRMFRERKR